MICQLIMQQDQVFFISQIILSTFIETWPLNSPKCTSATARGVVCQQEPGGPRPLPWEMNEQQKSSRIWLIKQREELIK